MVSYHGNLLSILSYHEVFIQQILMLRGQMNKPISRKQVIFELVICFLKLLLVSRWNIFCFLVIVMHSSFFVSFKRKENL